jgi:hypothetical protein
VWPASAAFLLRRRRAEVTLSWRLGPLAVRQRLRRKPRLKGLNIVEDNPAELYAWRPDVVAVPIVERPRVAPYGFPQLRLCQVTVIDIEGGRADRVDNALFENRYQNIPPRLLAPPGRQREVKARQVKRTTEKASVPPFLLRPLLSTGSLQKGKA